MLGRYSKPPEGMRGHDARAARRDRLQADARNAAQLHDQDPGSRTSSQCRNASCTTSSASATDPNIR
jgi:hypothetical protein